MQPSDAAAVKLLLIGASDYTTPLTYKVAAGTAVTSLSGPQLFGGGAVVLLGVTLDTLSFSSTAAQPIDVEILVARDATV